MLLSTAAGREGIDLQFSRVLFYQDSGRKVVQSKIMIEGKEYLLRVVYEESEEKHTVVTAYLTTQISRYWKEAE